MRKWPLRRVAVIKLAHRRQGTITTGERLDIADSRMPLTFDDDGVNVRKAGTDIGDNGTLCDPPVPVERTVAKP